MLLYHSSDLIWTHCFALAKPSFWISITMLFALSMVLAGCFFPSFLSLLVMMKYLYIYTIVLVELTSIFYVDIVVAIVPFWVHGIRIIVDTKIIYHCFLCWPSTDLGETRKKKKYLSQMKYNAIPNTKPFEVVSTLWHDVWLSHKKHFPRGFTTFVIDCMVIAWLYSCIPYSSKQQ